MMLSAWSHLVAALAYSIVAMRVPAGLGARARSHIRWALCIWAAWSLFIALDAVADGVVLSWVDRSMTVALFVRYIALLLLVASVGALPRDSWLYRLNLGVCCTTLLMALLHLFFPASVPLHSLAGLLLSLLGLVNVEQLVRNAPATRSRAIKLLAVGIGGQIAYDLFLYSQAQLLGALDVDAWALRGFILLALSPMVDVGLHRRAQEMSTLFVSRQVVFYTSAILSVGIYLVIMALGGYYVRMRGGNWGEALRLIFFLGAAVVLALLLLSPAIWRRWRVFVAKHFYRNKYDYRVEWLRFIDTLSANDSSDARVASIRAIAQIFESPSGVLFLQGEGENGFNLEAAWSALGSQERSIPNLGRDEDLSRFLAERQWVIDLREYRLKPALYGNINLPGWLSDEEQSWRIINPLFLLDRLIGFLVLQAPPEPFQMTFEDRDLLRTAGRHVATLLAQQAADRKLAEGRQFDAFNRFGAFVMHDLKNSVAQLQLLVDNASRHRGKPEFMDDAIETIGYTVARMTRLIEQLQSRDESAANRPVELTSLLQEVCARSVGRPPGVTYTSGTGWKGIAHVHADAERLGAVIEHVIRNAQEAAGARGSVELSVRMEAGSARISVEDNGPGMDPAFIRDRLFRPFDSTKGSKGMGVGAHQVREYVRHIGGSVEVQSTPGRGTTFLITLPLCHRTSHVS